VSSFRALMRDCFVRLKRSHHRAIHQFFDALVAEVFEETDAFFDEGLGVHDQSPLEFSNLLRGCAADILDFSLILNAPSFEEHMVRNVILIPQSRENNLRFLFWNHSLQEKGTEMFRSAQHDSLWFGGFQSNIE
jgi:hypothetical protein